MERRLDQPALNGGEKVRKHDFSGVAKIGCRILLLCSFILLCAAPGYGREYRFSDAHLHYVNYVLQSQGFQSLFSEMDKNKAELEKDLAQSNADEKVIEAIILSYRVKLEILDQMLAELRKSKETTQKPVETKL